MAVTLMSPRKKQKSLTPLWIASAITLIKMVQRERKREREKERERGRKRERTGPFPLHRESKTKRINVEKC